VVINPIITRVAGLNFEVGDQIGLTIVRGASNYATNILMSYNGSTFAATNLSWYDANDAATLIAYYPYVAAGVPTTFRVAADQSASCATSDLLAAVKTDVAPTSTAIPMIFHHMMTSVQISITNQTSSEVVGVVVGGAVADATVDLKTSITTVVSGVAATDIKAHAATPQSLYEVVIVPQTAALTVSVTTADGKVRTATFASNALLQSKRYTMGVVVEKEKLIPTLSGEVADWSPGGALAPSGGAGESGGGSGDVTTGTMLCQGESYKTVTYGNLVWMAENLRYAPAGASLPAGVWYPSGQPTAAKSYGMLYNQTMALQICPSGWRLPTEADFAQLLPHITQSFVPLAGVYHLSSGCCKYFEVNGYLMGSTVGEAPSSCKCCYVEGGKAPALHPGYSIENGISVRYVRNVSK
ncbi:MAG: fimbrillin family protein, partial [Alistipes sp.]